MPGSNTPPVLAADRPAPGVDDAGSGENVSSGVVRAAGINSLGNISSRILGLVRESVIAATFGASGATSVFDAISIVPKMVYELLIGGMLSAALVPVLSEYATEERQDELERILSILLSLGGVVLVAVVVLLEILSRWSGPILVGGFDKELLTTANRLVRIIVPAIVIYGFSGIIQAYHYARRRFVHPAMGAPAHNVGNIVAVVLLAGKLDIASLSVGILIASATQLLVQLPGLRGTHLSFDLNWRHPVVRRILKLYAPVVLSIVIQNVGIILDRSLASRTVEEAITWMNKATYLIQLPLGLVSMAISLAVLPVLSQIDAQEELDRFKRTLSLGLRMVLVLIIPAAVGLLVLGEPLIRLFFERGAFSPEDTAQTWQALRYYLPGLPFAAIDLPLVFAFYAQKDTKTPVIVGIIGVVIYLLLGPPLAFWLDWGYLGLVLANSVQLISHALIMLVAFAWRFKGLRGYGLAETVLKSMGASLLVAALGWGSYSLLSPLMPPGAVGKTIVVGLCAGLGAAGYVLGGRLLRIQELNVLWQIVQRRFAPAKRG